MNSETLRWIEEILSERFGHNWHLKEENDSVRLTLQDSEGDIIFDQIKNTIFFTDTGAIPHSFWRAETEGWTSIFEEPLPAPGVEILSHPLIEIETSTAHVHYNILGLIYWMFNRVEEIYVKETDKHQRFPAAASHSTKFGYIDRPIVDEWLEILKQVIERIWPQLEIKKHAFSIKLSHDVDRPSRYGYGSTAMFFLRMGADFYRKKQFTVLSNAPIVRYETKSKLHPSDPYNTFEWILDTSEKYGLRSAFYFLSGVSSNRYDGDYDIEHPAIIELINKIHQREHEIGLHPSYNSYLNLEIINIEKHRLARTLEQLDIDSCGIGSRMHYLRWKQPETIVALNSAGIKYDNTLTYAEAAGFRCGTCFEYPGFDPIEKVRLKIRIRPLIVMEDTILSKSYMGLKNQDEAFKKILALKDACNRVRGCFTMLWHNCSLVSNDDKKLYESILATTV